MLGSLRVRLPLVFLAGIVLAGVITTAISIRLFQQFTENQTLSKLNREANGIAALYSNAVNQSYGNKRDRRAPQFAAENLEKATGDRIYYLGGNLFPGQGSGLRPLPQSTIDWHVGKSLSFTFTPPDQRRPFLAIANPIALGGTVVGAIIVATPKTDVRQQVNALIARLAIAGVIGLLIAALLAWYLSRRIVRPILQLSDTVDEVAGGSYDVTVPRKAPGELRHLSERVAEMANRLGEVEQMERNFLMSVSHELRTPLTAIRGHVAALLEGVVHDPELTQTSLETIEAEAQRL
jgi:two-component system OmpR family sensor kinase